MFSPRGLICSSALEGGALWLLDLGAVDGLQRIQVKRLAAQTRRLAEAFQMMQAQAALVQTG